MGNSIEPKNSFAHSHELRVPPGCTCHVTEYSDVRWRRPVSVSTLILTEFETNAAFILIKHSL